jgi:anti-sigma regulatory factor (Ser/Thr protein kinase)
VVDVASRPDFFVSYTSVDRHWAEWIAWQLEAEGYVVVVQAWDFTPGRDWAHEMQSATSTAERVVAVLSPDYLHSAHGEAEWRAFYAKDPSGERALLLPVRVRDVNPPGLLKTKVYVDLVGRDVSAARDALLAAARGVRGKPVSEPPFPGATLAGREEPRFPPELPPPPDAAAPETESTVTLRAKDVGRLRSFSDGISASLFHKGFSDSDVEAFRISLRELVDNVANHVPADDTVRLRLAPVDRLKYTYQEGVALEVQDRGAGFDFDDALRTVEDELGEHGVEHGLLRAYRLGSVLMQASTDPHVMGWMREKVPQDVPPVFESKNVVPFVFSYRHEAIRIWEHVHTFAQFEGYLERSEAFMELVFDQLRRPRRPYVGIAVIGQGWTGVLSWKLVLDKLLHFATSSAHFNKELLLFADTGPSEQSRLREWCESHGIRMFEDESVLANIAPPARFRWLKRS